MDNDLLVSKMGTIERCCKRARDEYEKDPTTFVGDITRQDAATLNVIRAWEAAVEMGDHVLGELGIGPAQDEREVITLLATNIATNIREIEGAYNKIVAYTSLMHMPITVETAQKVLSDMGNDIKTRTITSYYTDFCIYLVIILRNSFYIQRKGTAQGKNNCTI